MASPAKLSRFDNLKTIVTGVSSSSQSRLWVIQNFGDLLKMDGLLQQQFFKLKIRQDGGDVAFFRVGLIKKDDIDAVAGIALEFQYIGTVGFVGITDPDNDDDHDLEYDSCEDDEPSPVHSAGSDNWVYCKLVVEIKGENGNSNGLKKTWDTQRLQIKTPWRMKICNLDASLDSLPLIDKAMHISIELQVDHSIKLNLCPDCKRGRSAMDEESFKRKSKAKVGELVSSLQDDVATMDVKLVAKGGEEFSAHRLVLSGSSPVLKAMLTADMTEKETGVITCDDLSGNCIKILLHFMYTGSLEAGWSSGVETISELVYAAEKYQLKDLLEFLEGAIGKLSTVENVSALFNLANTLGFEKTKKEIQRYMKSYILAHINELVQNEATMKAVFENI